jgi:hypothetical protein
MALQALVRASMDALDAAPSLASLLDTAELGAWARDRLVSLRRRSPTRRPGGLVYELCARAPLAVRDAPDLVVALAPAPRRELARALMAAGPWARTALLADVEEGWPSFVERLLAGHAGLDLDEAERIAASRLESPEALLAWLREHPPLHFGRAPGRLDDADQRRLLAALQALPEAPPWAEQVLEGLREAPAIAWGRLDLGDVATLDRLDAFLAERGGPDPQLWSACALRWALLGHLDRARMALRRAHPPRRWPTDQAEMVLAALRSLWKTRPQPATTAATPETSPAFMPDLLHLLRSEPDPSTRICLLSVLCDWRPGPELRSALEAEVEASLAGEGPVGDEAWGRASPHLSIALRTRMWGRAFSAARRAWGLPFGWSSHGALEVAASLREGEARDLVEWAARLEDA